MNFAIIVMLAAALVVIVLALPSSNNSKKKRAVNSPANENPEIQSQREILLLSSASERPVLHKRTESDAVLYVGGCVMIIGENVKTYEVLRFLDHGIVHLLENGNRENKTRNVPINKLRPVPSLV